MEEGYELNFENGVEQTIKKADGTVLMANDPALKIINDKVNQRSHDFLLGMANRPGGATMNNKMLSLIDTYSNILGGTQAGATAPPKPSSHPAAKLGKDPNTGVPGWYIPNPDPNSKDKFLLVT